MGDHTPDFSQMKQTTVLSHNVFWFQGVPFPTDKPPGPDMEILTRLCEIYGGVNPDVICLQEIQSEETFQAVSECLEMAGCYCPGRDLPQYGGAVFWRSDSGRESHNSLGSTAETQRMWQIVEADGVGDCLRICNVHLPSARQLGREKAARQRIDELQQAIRSCEGGLDIIVGDFNERPGGPVGECMEKHGYVDAAVISNCMDQPTGIGSSRGDYIWVRREMSACFSKYSVAAKRELACGEAEKEYLSDHLPLWIMLEY